MHRIRRAVTSLLFFTVLVSACQTKKEGSIEGSINPPTASARIAVIQDNKEIMTVSAGAQDGKFKVPLAAGTYSIRVSSPDAPYPVPVSGIMVKPGLATVLPPIEFMPRTGKAILSGRISPPRPGAEVTLFSEGRERASVHTDQNGMYELKEVPAGTYEVRTQAPGHAADFVQVVAADGQRTVQTSVLFPIAPIDGVDWASGRIRATGIGMPPPNAPSATVGRELAKRAALADAQRNMLKIIEQIRLNTDQTIKNSMGNPQQAGRIQGFLQGYTVVSERELDGGKYEIIIELPLNGPTGLTRYVSE